MSQRMIAGAGKREVGVTGDEITGGEQSTPDFWRGGLHWNGWTRRNREEDGDWTKEKSGKVTHISPGTYQILILSLQLILSVSPMSDMWPGSSLMGLLCTRTMLMRGVGTTNLFHPYHCYDYRAAYLNPYMIHKTLENKQWKWSCQLLCAIGFSPRRWQNSLLWITLPKKITQFPHQNHTGKSTTHISILPVIEFLAKHN